MKTDSASPYSVLPVKNIVISGTNFWNPGDDFVRDGVTEVLRQVFPRHVLNFLFYNFNADFFPQSKFAGISNLAARGDLDQYREAIDAVVIAGLSAGDEIKDLYRWVIDNHLQDRVYLIGAGYENNYVAHHIAKEPEATIFRHARIIIGRTAKTPDFIPALGLQYLHLNCPALLSVKQVKSVPPAKRIERIGFSIQLPYGEGLMNQACPPGQTKLALEILMDLAGKFAVEVVAHHKTEYFFFLKLLRGRNIPVIFSSFYQDLHTIYPRYDLVVTTRLHSSLFANGFGIPGIIVNDTDRHTHTLQGFPHSAWINSRADFEREFQRVCGLDLAQVTVEARQFKEDLMARYVGALAAPFGLEDFANGTANATPAPSRGPAAPAPAASPKTVAAAVPAVSADLPIHFFTIVVNGKPFIEHHIRVFQQLSCKWHWHIIEGIAAQNHDTAWSQQTGGRITAELHRAGLSTDGTTEYLDELARQFPQNITLYRKPAGAFWDGKLEMVNAPLANIPQESLLWQVDADELWTAPQLEAARQLFKAQPDKTAAFYLCHYFVGPELVITSRNTYGNHLAYEWLRTWRFQPGDRWVSHEPPRLCRPGPSGTLRDLGGINPLRHAETETRGLIFQHYAYATEAQLRFKEVYYGYAGAVSQWQRLQAQPRFPLRLANYFNWVKDGAEVNTIQSQGIVPLAPAAWFAPMPAAGQSAAEPRRILLVRTDSIGDNVLAAAMLQPLRQRFPEADLAVLCQEHIAELYVASPHVNTVICFATAKLAKDPAYRESILAEIREFAPDLILNSIYSREWTVESLLLHLRGVRAIGMEGNLANISAANRAASNALYEKLIASQGPDKTELDHHRDFLAGVGIPAADLKPSVWTTPEDEAVAQAFFDQHGLNPDRTIALFPGSLLGVKVYPHWAQALQALKGCQFLLLGGAETEPLCEQLAPQLPGPAIVLSGRTTLREMASLIRRCRLLVGVDSSGPHIACAVGVPNVVVLGGGQFGRFFPYSPLTSAVTLPLECYQCNWCCRYSRNHCIRDIAPEAVAEAIRVTLAAPASRPRLFVQTRYHQENPSQPRWTQMDQFISAEKVEVISVPGAAPGETSSTSSPIREPLPANTGAQRPAAQSLAGNPGSQGGAQPAFTPKISAIVSVYKAERFIRGCLEDLERQTIASELEIIVVDSASPQNERRIVEEFQQRYSNIVYIRSDERETVYGAWNRGIQAARGHYITNANTDDRHRSDALEILARTLDQNPDMALVYADCLITRTENETFEAAHPVGKYEWLDFSPADLVRKGCFVGPQPMWRRALHPAHGYFDPTFVSAGDYEFWMRLAQTQRFLHVKQTLGLYLQSPTSVEHSNQDRAAQEVQEARRRYGAALVPGFQLAQPNGSAQPANSKGTTPGPVAPAPAPAQAKPLPACARLGHLGAARELLGRKCLREAWEATLACILARPFHPEAYLLLADIALAAGAAKSARLCAQRARDLAPEWNAPKKFLQKSLKGNAQPEWLVLPETPSNRLSLCLITKNEERFLASCLKSVQGLAHQIVVVDTGSTDGTIEIAKAHGAEIHSFAWCDDFSAARNAALEHARGDWVLIIDADEELPEDQHARLQADLKNSKLLAVRLPIVNHGQEAEGQAYVPRLFRNAPGVCFRGRIHEQVFPSLLPLGKAWGLSSGFGTAQLRHYGYAKAVVQERKKAQRNLSLLRQAVEETPEDANLVMNLGLELVRAGELQTGLTHYREAFRLMSRQAPGEVPPELREALLTQFATHLRAARAFDEVVQVLTSPLANAGGLTASLHFALGLAYYELKQLAEAAGQLRQCLATLDQPTRSTVTQEIRTTLPHHCLALCLAQLGDNAGAEKAFETGLKKPGRVEELLLDYAKFLVAQKRPVDAFHRLHAFVTDNAQSAAAWLLGGQIALSQLEFLEFARDWTGEALNCLPDHTGLLAQRAEALLLSQEHAPARALWERLVALDRDPRALAALILCELLAGALAHRPQDNWEALATSRAFIEWYRKCLALGAKEIVLKLNACTGELRGGLPEAARILEAACAEAERQPVAEPCTV